MTLSRCRRCASARDEIAAARRSRFVARVARAAGARRRARAATRCARSARYAWPGNVRELRNVIERAVVVTPERAASASRICPRGCARRRRAASRSAPRTGGRTRSSAGRRRTWPVLPHAARPKEAPPEGGQVRGKVQQYEAKLIQDMLETAGWNRTEAARRLGIPVRTCPTA